MGLNSTAAPVASGPGTIQVFTVGGTIDKVYFDGANQYRVGPPVLQELFDRARVTAPVRVRPLLRKDSLELTDADRALIRSAVRRCRSRRILITHGTDSMDQTAQALADVPGKVVVLTGAFAPARFADSDAAFNLGLALGAVQTLADGVYVAINGQIFDGTRVRKNRQRMTFVAIEQVETDD